MPKVRKQRPSIGRATRSNPLSTSNANAKKEPSQSPQSGKRERLERIERKSEASPGPQRTLKSEDNNDIPVNSTNYVKAEEQNETGSGSAANVKVEEQNGPRSGSAANVKVERKRWTTQSPEENVKDEDRSETSLKLEQDERRELGMHTLPKLEGDVKTEHKHEEFTKREPGFISEQHDHTTAELTNGDASNYLIQAYISTSSDPTVTRLLSVPPDLTFDKLHEVLQVAFGWASRHLHRFEITDSRDDSWRPARLLSLCPDPSPLVDDLGPNDIEESEWTLADVYEKPEWKDRAQIGYEYDMGDSWHHILALLGRATPGTNAQFGVPDDAKVVCLSGQGHPVAEDCGGRIGWEDLKNAFKHPRRAGNRDLVKWYKDGCVNGDPGGLDPYKWDILDINDGLREAGFFEGQAV